MCLVLVAQGLRDDVPLVIAANRDEFLDRPTAPAAFWPTDHQLLAGRDLRAGGTWLGVNRYGRVAAVTNIREPARHSPDARSRGDLPAGFLSGDAYPVDYLRSVQDRASDYNGFNLLVGDGRGLWYASNRDGRGPRPLQPGAHGLSNAPLPDPWPKVRAGLRDLRAVLDASVVHEEAVLDVLLSDRPAPDDDLPDTGVGIELERALSSRRIRLPDYGTRASTVILYSSDGHISFLERTWSTRGGPAETRRFRFRIETEARP